MCQVTIDWMFLRLGLIPALLLTCSGCGGVNATGGASPASFFLPGLLKADPPPSHPERAVPLPEPDEEVAQS